MSNNIIHLNEGAIKLELKELVRNSVEETLNELLEKEAQELTNAERYERTEGRQGYRSGHYERNLQPCMVLFSTKLLIQSYLGVKIEI